MVGFIEKVRLRERNRILLFNKFTATLSLTLSAVRRRKGEENPHSVVAEQYNVTHAPSQGGQKFEALHASQP